MKLPMVPKEWSKEQLWKELKSEFENPTSFIDRLRMEFDDQWRKIDEHPFLVKIEKGTLPRDKYKTYAIQNYYYFITGIRRKAACISNTRSLLEAKIMSDQTEMLRQEADKYVALIKAFGVTEEEIQAVFTDPRVPLPSSRAYTDFLYNIYSNGSASLAAVAILPCGWTYSPKEIGGLDCPLRVAKGLADHYGIDREIALAYGNYSRHQHHLALMKNLKEWVNHMAEREDEAVCNRIRDIFRRAIEYEYKWWDTAYRHDPSKKVEIASYF